MIIISIFLNPMSLAAAVAFGLLFFLGYILLGSLIMGLKAVYPKLLLYGGVINCIIAVILLIIMILALVLLNTEAGEGAKKHLTWMDLLKSIGVGFAGTILGCLVGVLIEIPYTLLGMLLFYPHGVDGPQFYENLYFIGFAVIGFIFGMWLMLAGALSGKKGANRT